MLAKQAQQVAAACTSVCGSCSLPQATIPCSTTQFILESLLVLATVSRTNAKPTSRVPGANQTAAEKKTQAKPRNYRLKWPPRTKFVEVTIYHRSHQLLNASRVLL